MAEQHRVHIPEWSVSELSAALKRTVEDSFGFVRVRGEISGYRGPRSFGPCSFALNGEREARRRRRADGAPGGTQEEARRRGPVRRGAKAAAALAAGRDRRRHL